MPVQLADERDDCRICGSRVLRTVLDLGRLAVSDFTHDAEPYYAPLVLALCDPDEGGCGFVQLRHKALDQSLLYRRYWYRSGINEFMRTALADIAASAERALALASGDVVLDIGANDGTLLRSYSRQDFIRVAFEPAQNLVADAAKGGNLVIPEFFSADAFFARLGADARARVITSIAMFYDIEQPHEFVRDIVRILAPDGLWILQMNYLSAMLADNVFDNISHEHVGYYSLAVVERLARAHGLEIRDVELNNVNGGSFRLYLQRQDQPAPRWVTVGGPHRVAALARAERDAGLAGTDTYREFALRIVDIRQNVRNFIVNELSAGKVFHVYGASTRGNTILQYFGLDRRHFQLAADRNPEKWGLRTVATEIPIVSEQECRTARPDYFFVLPWHLRDTFVSREREYLEAGGGMVFPLPEPSLVRIMDGEYREFSLDDVDAKDGRLPQEAHTWRADR